VEQIIFTTSIPNDFLDIHLPVAKPIYSVVYLHGYRQYARGERKICCNEIAEAFEISVKRVKAIWEYWQELGLVEILSSQDGIMELAFLYSASKAPAVAPVVEQSSEYVVGAVGGKVTRPAQQSTYVSEFPDYSLEDVRQHLENPEVQRLFYTANHVLCKQINDIERRMFLAFYDDLGLCVDVISVMLEYCVNKGKTHNNYIRTVAHDWAERGIANAEEAEEYIRLFDNEYREILRFCGIRNRDPIGREIKFMEKWLKVDGYNMEMIKLACERTIMSKAQPHFGYTDGIIKRWKKDDIHTAEQVEALEKEYYDSIKATRLMRKPQLGARKKQNVKRNGVKSRFQNYKGRKWDYDKLAQMEHDYLNKKVAE